MKPGILRALLSGGLVLVGAAAPAQTPNPKAWSVTAAASTYLLPDESDYVQPTVIADRDHLHLEARYNYEGLKTGSAWLGYNLSFGEKVTFEITPMVGGVFGETSGIAPGYKLAVGWRKLDLSSESEYMFDSESSSNNFFYTWSELGWSPTDWLRLGLVVQRTKAYQTQFDIQRGLLVGLAWKKASFTTYAFNLDADKPTIVLGLSLDF